LDCDPTKIGLVWPGDGGNVMALLSHIVGRIQVAAFLIHAASLNANREARATAFRVYIAEGMIMCLRVHIPRIGEAGPCPLRYLKGFRFAPIS
jgi:hypothetical protein